MKKKYRSRRKTNFLDPGSIIYYVKKTELNPVAETKRIDWPNKTCALIKQ